MRVFDFLFLLLRRDTIKAIMTICYFGNYNRSYPRNKILIKGLERSGVKVIECHDDSPLPVRFFRLFKKHWEIRKNYDVMVVGFPGQGMAIFAKLITRKPVVLDAFYSMYNTIVEDRKLKSKYSFVALYNYFLDWLSVRVADKVFLDTNEHIAYFVEKFGANPKKFFRIWIGADDDIFVPRLKKEPDKFVVGFHGTYIPLQGVNYIIEAAKILEDQKDIEFLLIGNGHLLEATKKQVGDLGLKNVRFVEERVPQEKIADFIAGMDVCLGIFGDTNKTQLVIPNKVYECAAMEKSVITADTPAIRELFDENDLFLIPAADPRAIARGVLKLKGDVQLRNYIAGHGLAKFREFATVSVLGRNLTQVLESAYN